MVEYIVLYGRTWWETLLYSIQIVNGNTMFRGQNMVLTFWKVIHDDPLLYKSSDDVRKLNLDFVSLFFIPLFIVGRR